MTLCEHVIKNPNATITSGCQIKQLLSSRFQEQWSSHLLGTTCSQTSANAIIKQWLLIASIRRPQKKILNWLHNANKSVTWGVKFAWVHTSQAGHLVNSLEIVEQVIHRITGLVSLNYYKDHDNSTPSWLHKHCLIDLAWDFYEMYLICY